MLVDNVMTEHKEMVLRVAVGPRLLHRTVLNLTNRLGH